jgi:uncharacterized protein YecE (DUF72 family)
VSQLDLFGAPDTAAALDPSAAQLAAVHDEARTIAAALDPRIRFGTSSWSFPGWRGLVYSRASTERELAREGLREYARHPLLRTVGIDRSYYAPIPDEDLRRYASQLPGGFLACAKAGASVTSAVRHGGRGEAPTANPTFLAPDVLIEEMLDPFRRHFHRFCGPILLEFPPLPRALSLAASEFLEGLDRFLEQLPQDFRYAIELREASWLTRSYAAILKRHGASHVFNYWSAMPMPAEQAAIVAPEQQDTTVIRLLLPPGSRYEQQREAFRPFDRLRARDPVMREQVVAISRRALAAGGDVFVLVNNKAEGSSPLTVTEIARLLNDS